MTLESKIVHVFENKKSFKVVVMKSQKEEKRKAILAAKIIKMKLKFSLKAATSRSSNQNELCCQILGDPIFLIGFVSVY